MSRMSAFQYLRSVRNVCLVLSVIMVFLALWWPMALCLVGPLWLFVALCTLANRLYRPEEDHVGVVYRLDRFHTYVDPNEFVLLCPGLDDVRFEVSLRPRVVSVDGLECETRDHVRVVTQLTVFYRLDPRRLKMEELRSTLLTTGVSGVDEIVRRSVTSHAHSVMRGMRLEDVDRLYHRRSLNDLLSRRLNGELTPFGLVLHHESSVSVLSLYVEDSVRRAKVDLLTAEDKGEALLRWLGPLLSQFHQASPGDALTALMTAYAAAMLENGRTLDALPGVHRYHTEEEWLPLLLRAFNNPELNGGSHSNDRRDGRRSA